MANALSSHLRRLGQGPGPVQNEPAPPHPGTAHLVYSRHLVEWVEPEPFRLKSPSFAEELVGREPLQGFEATREVISGDEISEMRAQLLVRSVGEPPDRCFLDGAVHPLD